MTNVTLSNLLSSKNNKKALHTLFDQQYEGLSDKSLLDAISQNAAQWQDADAATIGLEYAQKFGSDPDLFTNLKSCALNGGCNPQDLYEALNNNASSVVDAVQTDILERSSSGFEQGYVLDTPVFDTGILAEILRRLKIIFLMKLLMYKIRFPI